MISPYLANHLWHASSLPRLWRFRRAASDSKKTQIAFLRRLLSRHASTRFGKEHDFRKLRDISDFQRGVPISDYSAYQPWIERIARGETRILTADRVTHLVPTSGSTAARKLIPWTAGLQDDFNRAIGPWIGDLFQQFPSAKAGPAYWSVSPAGPEEKDPRSGIPIGFADDTEYLGRLARRIAQGFMAVPSAVRHVNDIDTFRYLVLLFLAASPDLRLVSVWHPTFFPLLLDSLPEHFDRILKTLHTGVLEPPKPLTDSLSAALQSRLPADSRRAQELAAGDPAEPATLWPHLCLLSAWGTPDSPNVRDLCRRFPSAAFQSKGLLATEAVVTIPVAGQTPLAIDSHFFEFLDETGTVHLAHELENSRHYEVVVTTSGGLYRYRLGDSVEITGFFHRTPCLRFIGRIGKVSDLRGEKLEETFVGNVLDQVLAPLAENLSFRLLVPDLSSEPPGYTLVIVSDPSPPRQDLATPIEDSLRENPHYRLCQFLGQLRPVRIQPVDRAAMDRYFCRRTDQGLRLGDIKPVAMDTDPAVLEEVLCWPTQE